MDKLLKQKRLLIIIIVVTLIFIIYNFSRPLPLERYWMSRQDLPLARHYFPHENHRNKTILYWNTFFGKADMYFGTGSTIFQNCSTNSCFATSNRSLMPTEQYDAIIFHGPRYSIFSDGYPAKRSVQQKYIFYSLEAPYNVRFDPVAKLDFYNWTMTYRTDSNIHAPYNIVMKQHTDYEIPSIEQVNNKTKKVAWFVSNCYTEGSKRRFKYATELSKYIPVDIYGKCGTLKCADSKKCYNMLQKDYKFYLSFENSMCKDYVTEKLYNILRYNVVPIVLGIFSYKNISPPHSVINTVDFTSPQKLATYLWKLDSNPEEYLKYFQWKKTYVVKSSNTYTLCQLCALINQPLKYSNYENIEEWFYGFNCCL